MQPVRSYDIQQLALYAPRMAYGLIAGVPRVPFVGDFLAQFTSSAILAPPVPRGDASVKSEKEPAKASVKSNARPMAPAKPIETPKPVSAPGTPTRPTED